MYVRRSSTPLIVSFAMAAIVSVIGHNDRVPTAAPAAALASASRTARLLRDPRMSLLLARTGLLQAMHPDISDALVAAPGFFDDPWECVAPLADLRTGTGIDAAVRPRLTADAGAWVHATLLNSLLVGADLLGHPLNAFEQEDVHTESLTWPAVTAKIRKTLPASLHEYREQWHVTLTCLLEPTEAVLVLLRPGAEIPAPSPIPVVGGVLAKLGVPGVRGLPLWVGRGLLPPEARETLGLDWSAREERALQALFAALRLT